MGSHPNIYSFFLLTIEKKYVYLHFQMFDKMSHKTAIRVYEIASYMLILAATVIFFVMKMSPMRLPLTMILLALAIGCRWMMERHRFKSAEAEIDQLQEDLRKLTLLLAQEKKKNQQQK